jgi:PBP1b-binding outer membrane lipoprotein LpoB
MNIKIYLSLIFFAFTITSCQRQHISNKNDKTMTETTKPNNPYYSRTDTAKLDLPDSVCL